MPTIFTKQLKPTFAIAAIFVNFIWGFGQIGIHQPKPNKNSMLHISADDRGVLFPELSAQDTLEFMPDIADGMFYYDGKITPKKTSASYKFRYYRKDIKLWQCLNPWDAQNTDIITAPNTKLVTIGSAAKKATLQVNTVNAQTGYGIMPLGGIALWSGSASNFIIDGTNTSGLGTGVLNGWALCNGNNKTPNLSGRFVLASDATASNLSDPPGGNAEHTLTEAELPVHTHSGSLAPDTKHYHSLYIQNVSVGIGAKDSTQALEYLGSTQPPYNGFKVLTSFTGKPIGGKKRPFSTSQCTDCKATPISVMPPYFVLAFIMRVK